MSYFLPNVGGCIADSITDVVAGTRGRPWPQWSGIPCPQVFQGRVENFAPMDSFIASVRHQKVADSRDASFSVLKMNNLTENGLDFKIISNLTTCMLRASLSPLWMGRRFSNIKVFILAQMSRGAKVTVSEMQSCSEMLSDSMGAFRFCSSSGYFQKYKVLSEISKD